MRPQLLAVACSFRVADKLFVADCSTGGVAVMRRTAAGGPQLHPAVPSTDSAPGERRPPAACSSSSSKGCHHLL